MKKLFLFAFALAMTANVLAQFNPQTTPLTLEARDANTQLKVYNKTAGVFEYQINGQGAKQTIASLTSQTIDLPNVGDYIQLWGNQAATFKDNKNSLISVLNGFAYVYGNIMSLVQNGASSFENITELQADSTFHKLFYSVSNLDIHPTKDLVLPATSLTTCCYSKMFMGCAGLTKAPLLPATTMAPFCYEHMFDGCRNITQAPALPAITLATSCYNGMFYECNGLTQAPELPATQLARGCYANMFFNCSSLTTAPVILPATQLAISCYVNMFRGCSGLQTAPILPAAQLVSSCYNHMFFDCTSLNRVECYTLNYNSQSTTSWLNNVSATGTFVRMPECTSWPTNSASGIPAGWTVEDYNQTVFFNNTSASIVDTAYISLSCTTAGASIYYTTDGSAPSATNGTLYTTPIFVDVTAANENSSMAIIAVAIKNGESSALTTRNYELSRTNCQLIASIQSGQGSYSVPAYAKYGDEVTVEVTPGPGCTLDYIAVNQIGRLEGNTFVVPAHHDYLNVYIYLRQVYAITWKNFNDTVLAVTNVDMGYAPEYPYGTPHRDDEEGWEYTFSGWSPTLVQVTEDATYTAQYTATKKKYHVTFVDFDDHVIKEEDVFYQEAATAPADPTREGYTFAGWDTDFSSITSAITVKATYTINLYSVTVIAEHGQINVENEGINLNAVEYGTVLHFNALPDEGYELDAWSGCNADGSLTVTANTTVSASFKKQTFVVTLVAEHGQINVENEGINLNAVEYGTVLHFNALPNEGYELDAWSGCNADGSLTVTANTTVSASFKKQTFVVTLVAEHGQINVENEGIDLNAVEYGTVLHFNALPDEGYELDSWTNYNPETGLTVVDNITVTANFNLQTFQVTFVDWDDAVLKAAQTVNYGEAAVAPADPEREGYRFIGWDQDFSSVTANMTIMAQYEQLPSGIEAVFTGENAAKILRNGQIFILRGDKTYTLQGQEIK